MMSCHATANVQRSQPEHINIGKMGIADTREPTIYFAHCSRFLKAMYRHLQRVETTHHNDKNSTVVANYDVLLAHLEVQVHAGGLPFQALVAMFGISP